MRPELVLSDGDGVLVDSERITVALEARVLTSLGWPITPDQVVRRWMGRTGSAQFAEVAERLGPDIAERYDVESTAAVHRAFATVAPACPCSGTAGGLVAADVLAEAGAEVFGHMSEVPGLLGL